MLQPDATLKQTESYLRRELRMIYPEGESASLIRIILEHLGYAPLVPVRDPDLNPGPAAIAQINEIVSEIHTRKPIQYILGYTFFCDLRIRLNEHVLIPRPETEEMVCRITEQTGDPPGRVLDLGTGSGCVALALKKHFPGSDVFGLDFSREALKVAEENSAQTGLEVRWLEGDMMGELPEEIQTEFDLIVSNPPYVLESQRKLMDANVLQFEPERALFADADHPLVLYERIAAFASRHLRPRGSVWVEINEKLGSETARIFQNASFSHVTVMRDIHEKDRFIQVIRL
ncbi:MAG TPA: peptide chain release factor N(5)-glutamine methyltransferase [Bacteroides sp.]|nr:peptide chain release factor N(5)-glutamine methyltransferase [Bacteroides sp.]